MSGAPVARFFDVQFADGKTKRYRIEPRIFSDSTIGSLRGIVMKRKREARQELLADFAVVLKDMSPEAQAAFMKEALADAKKDQETTVDDIDQLILSFDKEAVATLLWSCSPDIDSYEEAVTVFENVRNPVELLEIISEIIEDEAKSAGNSARHPVKASRDRVTKKP